MTIRKNRSARAKQYAFLRFDTKGCGVFSSVAIPTNMQVCNAFVCSHLSSIVQQIGQGHI